MTTVRVLLVALAFLAACTLREMSEIEADAQSFATKMDGKPPRGVECVNADSDGDGYVTCTVFRVDRDPYSIQCAARREWSGCKPTVPKVTVQQ